MVLEIEVNKHYRQHHKRFHRFLYRHFKDYVLYNDMRLTTNQPVHFSATAIPHKFHNFEIQQFKI